AECVCSLSWSPTVWREPARMSARDTPTCGRIRASAAFAVASGSEAGTAHSQTSSRSGQVSRSGPIGGPTPGAAVHLVARAAVCADCARPGGRRRCESGPPPHRLRDHRIQLAELLAPTEGDEYRRRPQTERGCQATDRRLELFQRRIKGLAELRGLR